MESQSQIATGLFQYGAIGIMLLVCIMAIYKMAQRFSESTDRHQERTDALHRDYVDRMDKKDDAHESQINEILTAARIERENSNNKLGAIIAENTVSNRDLIAVINARLHDVNL